MNAYTSWRKLSYDEIRVATTLSSKRKMVAFAYDHDTKSAICAHMNVSEKSLQLEKIPISTLVVYPLQKTLDLVSDEKDPQGDLRGCIHYLNQYGLNETHWKTSWRLFVWDDNSVNGEIKVIKQET